MKRRRKLKAKVYYILYKIGFHDFAVHGLRQIYLSYWNGLFEQANLRGGEHGCEADGPAYER